MRPPRQVVSVRLYPDTIKDLDKLMKKLGYKKRSIAIRLLISSGFRVMGNWRRGA